MTECLKIGTFPNHSWRCVGGDMAVKHQHHSTFHSPTPPHNHNTQLSTNPRTPPCHSLTKHACKHPEPPRETVSSRPHPPVQDQVLDAEALAPQAVPQELHHKIRAQAIESALNAIESAHKGHVNDPVVTVAEVPRMFSSTSTSSSASSSSSSSSSSPLTSRKPVFWFEHPSLQHELDREMPTTDDDSSTVHSFSGFSGVWVNEE
ncbi:uncharacterized protein EI97DRAFT_443027 [Westerdykella ornata]|uniref:Uncharacterized protein n=1 Tax=Westerdykella ornata TaxID=318751 RepID=A0A6A6JGA6_WESOR|nr:uncharacterized protein EI97DRAFT_443027 [Westerdykella ornata]KAF2275581.1 hypothetical protein EI97DRAFT_443027 [Westerdykella ornata]